MGLAGDLRGERTALASRRLVAQGMGIWGFDGTDELPNREVGSLMGLRGLDRIEGRLAVALAKKGAASGQPRWGSQRGLFHVEQFGKAAQTGNCSTWNNSRVAQFGHGPNSGRALEEPKSSLQTTGVFH